MHLKPSTRPKKGRLPLQFLLELCHFLGSCCEARLRFQGFLLQVLILGSKGRKPIGTLACPAAISAEDIFFVVCQESTSERGSSCQPIVPATVLPIASRVAAATIWARALPREPNPSSPCVRHDSRGRARLFFFAGEKLRFAKTNLRSNFRLHLGSTWIKKRLGNISLSRHRNKLVALDLHKQIFSQVVVGKWWFIYYGRIRKKITNKSTNPQVFFLVLARGSSRVSESFRDPEFMSHKKARPFGRGSETTRSFRVGPAPRYPRPSFSYS